MYQDVCFPITEFWAFFHILYKPFIRYMFWKYFPPSLWLFYSISKSKSFKFWWSPVCAFPLSFKNEPASWTLPSNTLLVSLILSKVSIVLCLCREHATLQVLTSVQPLLVFDLCAWGILQLVLPEDSLPALSPFTLLNSFCTRMSGKSTENVNLTDPFVHIFMNQMPK